MNKHRVVEIDNPELFVKWLENLLPSLLSQLESSLRDLAIPLGKCVTTLTVCKNNRPDSHDMGKFYCKLMVMNVNSQ